MTNPLAEDTQGIVRSTFSLAPEQEPSLLDRAWMRLPAVPVPLSGLRLTRNAEVLLFYGVVLLPPLVLGCLYGLRARIRHDRLAVLVSVVALQAAVDLVFLRDSLNVRIQDVFGPATVLVAWLAHALGRGPYRSEPFWRTGASGLLVAAFIVVSGTVGRAHERIAETGFSGGWREIRQRVDEVRTERAPSGKRLGRATAEERQLSDYLSTCSDPAQFIFAPVLEPEIFFQSARGFAGGHVSLLAGYFNDEYHQRLMIERLDRQDVPYVVVTADGWPGQRQSIPRVAAWVETQYQVVARIGLPPGKQFIVMADTRRAPNRLWNGWPCFA